MASEKKQKLGAKAIIARVIAVILVTAIGGSVSFFGFKTYFANKLKKDKKAEIAKQLKEESKERVDVGMTQVGNSIVIRIYHNKNQEMIFVPLRADLILTLNDEGKKAVADVLGVEADTATVSDVIKSMKEDGKLIKEQVEKTLGISINSYETISQEKFVKLVNDIGDIKVDLEQAISYTDATEQSITLDAGENVLNGNAIYAILNDTGMFEDKNDQAEVTGEICVALAAELNSKTLSDYREFAKDYYDAVSSGTEYKDVSSYLKRMHQIKKDNLNFKVLDGTDSEGNFQLDTTEAKRVFDEMLSEEGDLDSALNTTEESEETTETANSSKDISIEIQNSTKISGLAGQWRDKLSGDGYTVGSIKTNRQGVLTHTKIIIAEKGMGQDLKSYFKNPVYEVGTVDSGAQICIIIGTEDDF